MCIRDSAGGVGLAGIILQQDAAAHHDGVGGVALFGVVGMGGVAVVGAEHPVSYTHLVFVGYAVGSAPIVSYHYGARNHAELHNLYSKSLRLIGVIAVVMTALSMLVIPYVCLLYTSRCV